ncbi:MAG: EamA family transporter [Desulfobacterales bacterium]
MNISESSKNPGMGYACVILAALLWAVSGTSAKYLFQNGVTPFQVVQLRITTAVAVLFLWFFLRRRDLLRIRSKDIVYFLILGSGAMAAVQFTYLLAISKIHVAAAVLIQYMAPGLIAIYSFVFARQKPEMTVIAALILAAAGCYLVVGGYRLDIFSMNRVGIISALLSAVAFAWYSLQGEYGMRRYPAWTVLFYALAFAAIPWNIFYPPLEAFTHSYSPVQWGWILYIAIMGTAMPFGLYLKGISHIGATRASITATLEPITAGIISYIFLNEVMEILQITGGLLVIASIILLQIKQGENQPPRILTEEAEQQ